MPSSGVTFNIYISSSAMVYFSDTLASKSPILMESKLIDLLIKSAVVGGWLLINCFSWVELKKYIFY